MLRRALVVCLAVIAGLGLSLVPTAVRAAGPFPDPVDCLAPAPDAAPGTPAWTQRDLANQWCSTQRQQDEWAHPVGGVVGAQAMASHYPAQALSQAGEPDRPRTGFGQWIPGATNGDPYRDPPLWTAAGRGRVQDITFISSDGAKLRGHLFAPPASVPGPYPGVVITTGSIQAYQELYYWAAEGLAEAGYLVMTYDVQGQGQSETFSHPCDPTGSCPGVPFQQNYNFFQGTRDALNWFFSPANPQLADLDTARVGIAGHSLGASAVSQVGQEDQRVHAIVAWDNLGAAAGVTPHAPALGINAEYFLNPTMTSTPPDPHAKDDAYRALRTAGIDTMQVALRQSTHLEFSYVPYILPASRVGERVAFHYTLAWFDKYLKGAPDALARLTATNFDGSSDAHSIGLGTWQPPTGNVPYAISGLNVPDRLSIYYTSGYWLDAGAEQCADMRAGCP